MCLLDWEVAWQGLVCEGACPAVCWYPHGNQGFSSLFMHVSVLENSARAGNLALCRIAATLLCLGLGITLPIHYCMLPSYTLHSAASTPFAAWAVLLHSTKFVIPQHSPVGVAVPALGLCCSLVHPSSGGGDHCAAPAGCYRRHWVLGTRVGMFLVLCAQSQQEVPAFVNCAVDVVRLLPKRNWQQPWLHCMVAEAQ